MFGLIFEILIIGFGAAFSLFLHFILLAEQFENPISLNYMLAEFIS
jgi:hypothetical protein